MTSPLGQPLPIRVPALHSSGRSDPNRVGRSGLLGVLHMPAVLLLLLLLLPRLAAAGSAPVTVLTIDGPITPASAAYFEQGLKRSTEHGSRLVVLKLDTPGGLDSSMRDIIKGILASPVPVATFVTPSGARAASAGTYILYASHIAAMATT